MEAYQINTTTNKNDFYKNAYFLSGFHIFQLTFALRT